VNSAKEPADSLSLYHPYYLLIHYLSSRFSLPCHTTFCPAVSSSSYPSFASWQRSPLALTS
jgi:hypothetical protein